MRRRDDTDTPASDSTDDDGAVNRCGRYEVARRMEVDTGNTCAVSGEALLDTAGAAEPDDRVVAAAAAAADQRFVRRKCTANQFASSSASRPAYRAMRRSPAQYGRTSMHAAVVSFDVEQRKSPSAVSAMPLMTFACAATRYSSLIRLISVATTAPSMPASYKVYPAPFHRHCSC